MFNLEVEEYCCESTFVEVVGLKSGDSILANFFPLKEKENEKIKVFELVFEENRGHCANHNVEISSFQICQTQNQQSTNISWDTVFTIDQIKIKFHEKSQWQKNYQSVTLWLPRLCSCSI